MKRFLQIRYFVLGLSIASILYLAVIPLRLALVSLDSPKPQAILTLGGGEDREKFAADFALLHPELEIWVSTGSTSHRITEIFAAAGVESSRLHLDYRALDTVTNFTTMVGEFQKLKIKHVYLLTSDFHMGRALAIAFWVFGSRGIVCTPIEIPSKRQTESTAHTLRDVGRSIIWLLTGKTGASIGTSLKARFTSLE
jgi:uncharacterized SAM-binding protein YcdF (DUF218 family)